MSVIRHSEVRRCEQSVWHADVQAFKVSARQGGSKRTLTSTRVESDQTIKADFQRSSPLLEAARRLRRAGQDMIRAGFERKETTT